MTKSAAAMQNIVLEEGISQKETTNFDPFETVSFKTQVDKSGHYSYYTRGDYNSYASYEYNGKRLIVSYDKLAGQKCTYESEYHGWSQYTTDTYVCSQKTRQFIMQNRTFTVIGLVFGFVFAFFAALVGLSAHAIKLSYSRQK